MLNGEHVDVYAYDPVSGRLASVQDALTGEVNSFSWNPEGTLARWEQPNSYARVFGYDEEGRLTKIERDHGGGNLELAYEYGYNSDGARVWQRDVLNGQEYRYVCRIGCGGVPMRVYNRARNGGSWTSVEDYLDTDGALGYGQRWQLGIDGANHRVMLAGSDSSLQFTVDYRDSFDVPVLHAMAVPCVEQVAAPPAEQPCPPLDEGSWCGQGEVVLAYGFTLCLLPTPCNGQERRECSECCRNAGGIMTGCFVEGGAVFCRCAKECTPAQWDACERDCQGQGRGGAIGCYIAGFCVNGRLREPRRICTCANDVPQP